VGDRALTAWIQQFLGLLAYVFVVLPYVRRVEGKLPRARRVYVCNHVSLLDTIVLGGIFWSRRRVPVLVLGDRRTWHRSFLRRLLSSHVGYLIERDRPSSRERLEALHHFAQRIDRFHLIVFPEGTRGDGTAVLECQPGIHVIAASAGVPIVPIAIRNMQAVSTKGGRFRPLAGLRRVTVRFGEEFGVEAADRDAFLQTVRERIGDLL
jgi:1-acyl-sn-glycerol-3-phosphate acyltransferase